MEGNHDSGAIEPKQEINKADSEEVKIPDINNFSTPAEKIKQKHISVLWETCSEFIIPLAIECLCSGKGSHGWVFFENPVASLGKKMGSALLTYSMRKRHEIKKTDFLIIFCKKITINLRNKI